jgi:hypothetical protein
LRKPLRFLRELNLFFSRKDRKENFAKNRKDQSWIFGIVDPGLTEDLQPVDLLTC